jgi:hypothetical protein
MSKATDEKFSEAETQKRFEAALRGARVAGAKHKAAPKNQRGSNKKSKPK